MFKKLRNKFLFVNLAAILIVLTIAFSSIFFITYKNVENNVMRQLDQTFEQRMEMPGFLLGNMPRPAGYPGSNPPSISFWMEVDGSKEIQQLHNPHFANFQEEIFTGLLQKVSLDKKTGFFAYNSGYWAYEVREAGGTYQVAFIDITNNASALRSMLFAFFIVSLISTVASFLFSKVFADRAIRPIKESYYLQQQFVSDASHELKTPLTIINTNIDLVLSNKQESVESQEQWLSHIKDESVRMSKLTNELLYLAKIDNHDLKQEFRTFGVSKVLEESTLSMEAIAFEKQLIMHMDIEPGLEIMGSGEQIHQVCIILLDNAIKYSYPNTEVAIRLTSDARLATITIENQGDGIDAENIEKVFNRFYRVDSSRNSTSGGHGLGLAIAKRIMDLHSATIKIESTPKQSTKVTLQFPLA